MPLHELLSAERIAIVPAARGRAAVIDAAARLLATPAGPRGCTAPAIGERLRSREQLASTGIGHGVAIPHGRVEFLEHSRGAFLRLAEPVDFGAADGIPVDLVLALAVPEHSAQQHLQILAELAERFADEGFRAGLRGARDAGELAGMLLRPAPQRPPGVRARA